MGDLTAHQRQVTKACRPASTKPSGNPRTKVWTMNSEWIDISIPLHNGMPYWPDNPPVHINRTMDLDRGDEAAVSAISIGSHTGTHMDAPSHFIRSGAAMDEMPLSATIGIAQVIEIRDPVA